LPLEAAPAVAESIAALDREVSRSTSAHAGRGPIRLRLHGSPEQLEGLALY